MTESSVSQEIDPNSPIPAELHATARKLCNAALEISEELNVPLVGLSLSEISRKAGLTPPGFYHHFNNLEELSFAVLSLSVEPFHRYLREKRRNCRTIADLVEVGIGHGFEFCLAQRRMIRFSYRQRQCGSDSVRAFMKADRARFVHELAEDLFDSKMLGEATLQACLDCAETVVDITDEVMIDLLLRIDEEGEAFFLRTKERCCACVERIIKGYLRL